MSTLTETNGWLTKQGGSIKTWKKRWCILKHGSGAITYAKTVDGAALGVINVAKSGTITPVTYKGKKNCFLIDTPERTWYLFAESESEMEKWVESLKQEKERLKKTSAVSVPGRATLPPKPLKPSQPVSPRSATVMTHSGTAQINQPDMYSPPSPIPSPHQPQAPPSPREPERVSIDDFELLTVIGKGSFGKVYQVKKRNNGKIYALKVLNKRTIIEKNEIEHTKSEKNILQKLTHPFLMGLHYSFQTPEKLYFVMDYVNGGELFYHLQNDKKFTEERTRFYCAEIACGLEFLHSAGVIYRDLKPENILITEDGHICLTDFGIAKEGLGKESDRTETFCGTPEYLAPEILEGVGYGKGVDWWSFGTLMFEMLVGLPPFYSPDIQLMYNKIISANLQIPDSVSEDAGSLIKQLLKRDADKRLIDGKKIKGHAWFRTIDWDKLVAKQIKPPYVPPVKDKFDTSMVDPTFTSEKVAITPPDDTNDDLLNVNFEGFTYVPDAGLKV